MALTPSELKTLDKLQLKLTRTNYTDELLLRYYRGQQRVEQLGMAIPPNMRKFLVIANWSRVVVDTINDRQQVRSLILPGEETADPALRAIWDANNMASHFRMFNLDRLIFGRGYLSVGSNEGNRALPFIRAESPREMVADIDVRREVVTSAARFYGTDDNGYGPTHATLYLPDVTVWCERSVGGVAGWSEIDRDEHKLGKVPVVAHINRRLSGSWEGESEMSDVIPISDAAARNLTNMQFAQEAHGIPRKYITGVDKADFVDADGTPIPQFEAYFDAITTVTNAQGKVGQLDAADLKNFETAMDVYGTQASIVTGFPARYFGLKTSNPPAEGAIRADESTLTRRVEAQNEDLGVTIGWIGGLALRFATGEWVEGNRVRTEWFDPATPTIAQREDALAKRRAAGVLSREGYWDELGWTEARKATERAYFAAEATDPTLDRIAQGLLNVGDTAALGG